MRPSFRRLRGSGRGSGLPQPGTPRLWDGLRQAEEPRQELQGRPVPFDPGVPAPDGFVEVAPVVDEIGQRVDVRLDTRVRAGWRAAERDPEENPFAAQMNGIQKYVVPTTLEGPLGWRNSTLIKENAAEEIANLKQGEGGDSVISGSGAPVRSQLQYELLDELKLMIHPIVVGGGKRLFEEGVGQTKLELLDSRTFCTGVLYLTYRPVA